MSDILRVFHKGCGGQVYEFSKSTVTTKCELEVHHTFDEIAANKYEKILHVSSGGIDEEMFLTGDGIKTWHECDSCGKTVEVEDDPPYKNLKIANLFSD